MQVRSGMKSRPPTGPWSILSFPRDLLIFLLNGAWLLGVVVLPVAARIIGFDLWEWLRNKYSLDVRQLTGLKWWMLWAYLYAVVLALLSRGLPRMRSQWFDWVNPFCCAAVDQTQDVSAGSGQGVPELGKFADFRAQFEETKKKNMKLLDELELLIGDGGELRLLKLTAKRCADATKFLGGLFDAPDKAIFRTRLPKFMDTLAEIASRVTTKQDREGVVMIWRYSPETDSCTIVGGSGRGDPPKYSPRMGYGVAGHVLQDGQTRLLDDVYEDPEDLYVPSIPRHQIKDGKSDPRSLLCVAIAWQGQNLGVISLHYREPACFKPCDGERVELISQWAAIGIGVELLIAKMGSMDN